jgi:hypothetical protein
VDEKGKIKLIPKFSFSSSESETSSESEITPEKVNKDITEVAIFDKNGMPLEKNKNKVISLVFQDPFKKFLEMRKQKTQQTAHAPLF